MCDAARGPLPPGMPASHTFALEKRGGAAIMPEEKPSTGLAPVEKGRPLIDLSGLAKVLPLERIYDDLAARGFRQIGALVEDWVKGWRLAMPGVQVTAVEQDRFRKVIENPYFRVPADRRVLPAPQLVAQVLEGVRYEPEGTPIWEMFEELLNKGCDRASNNLVHPAFAKIIGQLSVDEATMLRKIWEAHPTGAYSHIAYIPYSEINIYGLDFTKAVYIRPVLPELQFPENVDIYSEHMRFLALLDLISSESLPKDTEGPHAGWNKSRRFCELSEFGNLFMLAVSKSNGPASS